MPTLNKKRNAIKALLDIEFTKRLKDDEMFHLYLTECLSKTIFDTSNKYHSGKG